MKGPVGFGVMQDGNFGLLGVFVLCHLILTLVGLECR